MESVFSLDPEKSALFLQSCANATVAGSLAAATRNYIVSLGARTVLVHNSRELCTILQSPKRICIAVTDLSTCKQRACEFQGVTVKSSFGDSESACLLYCPGGMEVISAILAER